MMKTKKSNLILILTVAFMLSSNFSMNVAWAESSDGNELQPYTMIDCVKSFSAISNTEAQAKIMSGSSGITPFITSKVTLQSSPLGADRFTNVSGVAPEILTVYDAFDIFHICYFPITSNKDYRIKIDITDKVNGMQITSTFYKGLTR